MDVIHLVLVSFQIMYKLIFGKSQLELKPLRRMKGWQGCPGEAAGQEGAGGAAG